ncbi:MAG: hydrogenase maturation protease [Gammaproteobacteria bacterium]|nr:hydrogenase maturation protease [Gammaproteobacteria bacterium]
MGSPFGEDKLGWDIVDLLIQDTSRIWNSDRELTFHILDRPGPLLLEHLKNTDKVILVDAIHNTRHTHNLIRIGIDQLDQAGTLISSHGLGIKESLLLAKTLGQLPETIILGIEASIDMTTQEMESCKEKLIETIKQELD